jgi:hypothetical protein
MKGSKTLLVTLAMTAGLLALMVGLRGQYARLAAEHWRSQLDTVPDDQARVLLRQVAELGEPGIPVLVEALGSQRESVAREGKQALLEQLDRWQILRARASSPKLAVLADALAERVDRFGPTARNDAADLAARILLWPLDSRTVDRQRVIASCEKVFQASTVRGGELLEGGPAVGQPLPTERADIVQRRPLPVDDPMELGASLVDLSRLPGGGLPIGSFPEPAAPQHAVTTLVGDARAERPRRLVVPPIARPLDTWTQPARPATVPGESTATPRSGAPSDPPPPVPNRGRTLPLTQPADDPPGKAPGSFSQMPTVRLMQWLNSREEPGATDARGELIRRGFTEVHLELARRLFHPDAEVRRELVRLLPRVQSVDAAPWLEWLSRDPDPEVRLVAIGLIATTGDAALLDEIEQAARDDPDPRIRRQAERIAGRRSRRRH